MIGSILRWVLAWLYAIAGYLHLVRSDSFMTIMPDWVPAPDAVVLWTGIAEIVGALGLLQPWSRQLRQAAGIGLALYALCVWPANMNHFALDMARAETGDGGGNLVHSPKTTHCPWKGDASYFSIDAGGDINVDAAWTYTNPKPDAENIRDHIAFWGDVEITEI